MEVKKIGNKFKPWTSVIVCKSENWDGTVCDSELLITEKDITIKKIGQAGGVSYISTVVCPQCKEAIWLTDIDERVHSRLVERHKSGDRISKGVIYDTNTGENHAR